MAGFTLAIIQQLNNYAADSGCFGKGDGYCFVRSPNDPTAWCLGCLLQEAAKALAQHKQRADDYEGRIANALA